MLSFINIISSSVLYLTVIQVSFSWRTEGMTEDAKLAVELFNVAHEQNDHKVSKHASSLRFLIIAVILSRKYPAPCETRSGNVTPRRPM
jgi:hypothetical protein